MKKILEMFKQQISVELSENSIESYCSDVKDFLRRIKKKTNCTDEKIIDKIDSLLVSDVFMDMRTEYTMTTYNRKIVSVNAFCQYICDLGLKNINTCKSIKKYSPKKVRMEKATRPQKETLTIEEVRKILDTSIIQWSNFKEYRTKLILALMFTTGMRISEVINMKFSDLKKIEYKDSYAYMLEIREHKSAKFNGIKVVPIANKTLNLLELYLIERKKIDVQNKFQNYVILSNSGEVINRKVTAENIDRLVKICGINKTIKNHNQRVGFRTALSYMGVNETVIRQIGGWSLTDIEKSYVCDKNKDLEKIEICNII